MRPFLTTFTLSSYHLNDEPVSFSEMVQSFPAVAALWAWGVINAGAGVPRSSPTPPGP